MNPLWADILAQGNNTQSVLKHLLEVEKSRLEAAARLVKPNKPILLIGIASAAYLCLPSQVYLSNAGYATRVMNAADALYYETGALKNANIVINSRSGETAEIVKLAEKLHDESVPYLAITNEPDSTLARMANHVVWANTRKDDLVSINVVTGMMLTTLVWAAAVRGELEKMRVALETLPDSMTRTVERTVQMAEEMAHHLSGSRPIYLLGRGASQGATLCGRLVLEEVARHPAVALEAAEFRQGPNEVIDEHFGAILFLGSGQTVPLNRSLGLEIQRYGGKVITVGVDDDIQNLPGLNFSLPRTAEPFMPILEVVPVQGLAYKLAEFRGLTPGSVRYITKIIREEAADKT